MPPQLLIDLAAIDLNHVLFDQEAIRAANPQRGDMEMLNAIVYAKPEAGEIIGYKDVKDNEFWVSGHIPGRPLFPGVLMIEAGAQLSSFYTRQYEGWKGFIGFGGVDAVKFRAPVTPGQRLYLLGKKISSRHRRITSKVQGIVSGSMVFEAEITGTEF
jgi:3-hydroxyacyl-[acyl-carrier-protein] dehydratase